MGLGYAKIITETNKFTFDNWLSFLKKKFSPHRVTQNSLLFNYIDNEGNSFQISEDNVFNLLGSKGIIILTVVNKYEEAINCTIQMSHDNCYCFEEYGLDQLTSDVSRHDVFDILHSRYLSLHEVGHAIGFIYDKKGYSEDYINFQV